MQFIDDLLDYLPTVGREFPTIGGEYQAAAIQDYLCRKDRLHLRVNRY
jgi:hypothetical protein